MPHKHDDEELRKGRGSVGAAENDDKQHRRNSTNVVVIDCRPRMPCGRAREEQAQWGWGGGRIWQSSWLAVGGAEDVSETAEAR